MKGVISLFPITNYWNYSILRLCAVYIPDISQIESTVITNPTLQQGNQSVELEACNTDKFLISAYPIF